MSSQKVHIIGIGDDGGEGLTSAARRLIEQADLVLGPSTELDRVVGGKQRQSTSGNLDELVDQLESRASENVVILAAGDPLFYGVARYLCDRLGKERFEVVPHVSSMQLAFARVKESWDEAYLSNLATTDVNLMVEKTRTAEKVGLFTTDECPPAVVAKSLLERGIDYFNIYVCENLGAPDECVTQCSLQEVSGQTFAPLNVMIMVRKTGTPDRPTEGPLRRLFGNPDEAFLQSKPKRGLITPTEIRVLALADLAIQQTSTIWDVGAGSGSVAIEAAHIANAGRAYAIERDADDYQLISANAERLGVTNLIPILGAAPDAWKELPDPDAIFIGGTGRGVSKICELAMQRLRSGGTLVANISSINHVTATVDLLRECGFGPTIRMVNISTSTDQLESIRFESANPSFLLRVEKPAN